MAEESKLLHLGCGELVGAHWLNVDSSPNVLLDNHPLVRFLLKPILPESSKRIKFSGVKYLDLRKKWPYANEHFDAVFSSHFFEHLGLEDAKRVLSESFRCLKPGGKIRFLVPSIQNEIDNYLSLKRHSDPLAATRLFEMTNVFDTPPKGRFWYRWFFSLYNKNTHKMFYDNESLIFYFKGAGFTDVKPSSLLKSEIPFLNEVEKEDRYHGAICIEATRPESTSVLFRHAA